MKPRELLRGEIVQIDPEWTDGRGEQWFGGCLMVVEKTTADGADGYIQNAGVPGLHHYRCPFAYMEPTGGMAAWGYLGRSPHTVAYETEPNPATSTPSSRWSEEGKPDPHGKRYDRERAALCMGNLTDDELANAVFMCDHRRSLESIGYLTAVKDRLRWLSRALQRALASPAAAPSPRVDEPS